MKLIVANWKMNQSLEDISKFFSIFENKFSFKREAWIAPQFIHLPICLQLRTKCIELGAQNCGEQIKGAFTGEVSAKNLRELGAGFVIIGHSERRAIFHETGTSLNLKINIALQEKLKVIYCVGETLEEKNKNETFSVITKQLKDGLSDQKLVHHENFVIAYEPVWAIGTGLSAKAVDAQEVHHFIREYLRSNHPELEFSKLRILYGGSVKPENIEELLDQPDIDGALVGGASLNPSDFLSLCGE